MKPIRVPFGTLSHGQSATWPEFTGPSIQPRRHTRQPEIWERHADQEAFAGEFALEDLAGVHESDDALLVLARYLTIRVARSAGHHGIPGHDNSPDRESAVQYLDAMTGPDPEGRWLRAVLDSIDRTGMPGRGTISRMNAAANAAARRGHLHGAYSLHSTAWAIAMANRWYAEAGRVAASISAAASRAGGTRSQRLWSRRARVVRARIAS